MIADLKHCLRVYLPTGGELLHRVFSARRSESGSLRNRCANVGVYNSHFGLPMFPVLVGDLACPSPEFRHHELSVVRIDLELGENFLCLVFLLVHRCGFDGRCDAVCALIAFLLHEKILG